MPSELKGSDSPQGNNISSHGTEFVPWAFVSFNQEPTANRACRGYSLQAAIASSLGPARVAARPDLSGRLAATSLQARKRREAVRAGVRC